MLKHNQKGAVSGLVISLISSVIIIVILVAFGGWSFAKMLNYKNNDQKLINAAVSKADTIQQATDQAAYEKEAKSPFNTYTGPEQYGSIQLHYPKTWSGYVDSTGSSNSGALLDGYFTPGVVPAIESTSSVFALHVQVLGQSYAEELSNITSEESAGGITVNAYSLPKLSSVVGVEVTGNLSGSSSSSNASSTTEIILPLRAYTLVISTDGSQYLSDFNSIILANLTFSP